MKKQKKVKVLFYMGKDGMFYWRTIAPNGRIVCASTEGYRSRDACKRNYGAYGFGNMPRVIGDTTYLPKALFDQSWFPILGKKRPVVRRREEERNGY